MEMLTVEECKEIIRKLSKELCVRPGVVTERLLSEDDKKDMKNGDLPIESLKCHIEAWLNNGMPDYAHGNTETYAREQLQMERRACLESALLVNPHESGRLKYRAPFVSAETD